MTKKLLAISCATAFLGGCTMIPKYERPAAPVSQSWPTGAVGSNSVSTADIPWQQFFPDARLQRLIELSLGNNRDLRVAALRVEELRAQYRIQRAALLPSVDAGASVVRQRTSGAVFNTERNFNSTRYDLSVGASYELDIFGRIRSLKKDALERFFAEAENRKAAQIALVSEVASQYLTLLQLREAKALTEQTLEAVNASFNLNKKSFEAGVASELDLHTAEAQVQTAIVNVATFNQLLSEAENALVLLVGQPLPTDLPPGKPLNAQEFIAELPAGLPSELLQRRPDIAAAEHNLIAANADIGAARAAFFPRVLLTGSAGTVSAKLTDLFTGPSAVWSFAPQITIPIFQGGWGRANLDAAHIRKNIQIATYEKAIQNAFREVADALAVRAFINEKTEAQTRLVEAQQRRFDLTEARYRQGVDNYIAVLLAQQDLYGAQQTLLQFRTARLLNLISLYRALGGGWQS